MSDVHDTAAELPQALPPAPPTVPVARPIALAYEADWRRRLHPFLLPDLSPKAAWADIAIAAVLLVALEISAAMVFGALLATSGAAPADGDLPPQLQQELLVPGLTVRLAEVALVVGLILRARRQPVAAVGITARGWAVDIGIGTVALVVAYGTLALTVFLAWLLWPELIRQLQENSDRLLDLVPPLGPVAFIPVALLIGSTEELLFRGFLMSRLRRATGSWFVAVLLSTVLFTVLHAAEQTNAALLIVAVLSIIFSLLTVWRRSILPAIVAHALFDYSQFVLLHSARISN